MPTARSQHFHRAHTTAGKVITQPTGESQISFTTKSAVPPGETVHGLKCLHNCIDPSLLGTTDSPPESDKVVNNYMETGCTDGGMCNKPNPWQEVKVPIANFTFHEYSWQPGSGLNFCGRPGVSTGDASYDVNECTQSVAVPEGTMCQLSCSTWMNAHGDEEESCYCNDWSIKSTLFVGSAAADFKCRTTAGSEQAEGTQEEACLTHDSNGQKVANIDGLDEYYEYYTGVPSEWSNSDTVWLDSVEKEGVNPTPLLIEPPLQLTLEVPCDEAPPSISGIDCERAYGSNARCTAQPSTLLTHPLACPCRTAPRYG